MTRLLFVCLGNICRSPIAEGVMRHLVDDAGLSGRLEIDSAGTGAWHVGEPPDPRAVAAAAQRGVRVGGAARQVEMDDLLRCDLLLCADHANVRDLLARLPADSGLRAKVRRLREFDPAAIALDELDVPDPYYGGASGFDTVLEQTMAACQGLLGHVRTGPGDSG